MALDDLVHPVRAALGPPPISVSSSAPAAAQEPQSQQKLGLAYSAHVLTWAKLPEESFVNSLYTPWRNKAALKFAAT